MGSQLSEKRIVGWNEYPLGDICQVDWGNTKLTKKSFVEGGEFLAVSAAGCDGRIGHAEHSKFTPVLSAIGARCGRMFFPEEDFTAIKNTITLTPNLEYVTHKFLYYLLTSVKLPQRGAGQPFISKGDIQKFTVSIPSLEEQQRIVSILDEALENSKSMLDECKKKLLNSVELFRSLLHSIFDQSQSDVNWDSNGIQFPKLEVFQPLNEQLPSSTRGRKETERIIEGNLSLSVGQPSIIPRKGWNWSKLTNLARLESGHTPSRKFPEYWGGNVPWIGIKDARKNYGKIVMNTLEQTNQLGLDNSAARLLPKGTVCLSRTASVGYVVVMGTEMATSQDFVNWVCTSELDPHFLKFLLMAERDGFSNYSSGSVHQTIYFPEVKAFHICHPDIDTQRRIAQYLNGACLQFESLQELYRKEVEVLEQLDQSILQEALSGRLRIAEGLADQS
ncbi:restriction endonuclease subunit S [Candidatus Poseidonia alphae]|nr:restriction endonuclease subunit S [Candidatus Poseidonia alphae]